MPTYRDPIELFRAATDAMETQDWAGTAALCDPTSLELFQRELVRELSPQARRTLTVEELLRRRPDMPRAAAEFQVAEMQRYSDPADRLQQELPGVGSVEALRGLAPAAAFARFLEGKSPRRLIERLIARGQVPTAAIESIRATADRLVRPPELVGALPDGDNVTHVFYRPALPDETPRPTGGVPSAEDAYRQDLLGRESLSSTACRRQPDGGWLFVAGRSFLSGGQIAGIGFNAGPGDEQQEAAEEELSP